MHSSLSRNTGGNIKQQIKPYLATFLQYLSFAISLYAIHIALVEHTALSNKITVANIQEVHAVIFALTTIILVLLIQIRWLAPAHVGISFLATGILKMALVGAYFYIKIEKQEIEFPKVFTLNFFALYFPYLAMETYITFKRLIKKH